VRLKTLINSHWQPCNMAERQVRCYKVDEIFTSMAFIFSTNGKKLTLTIMKKMTP